MDFASNLNLAKRLRREQTIAERKMWWLLRAGGVEKLRFYRQFVIGPYVVDFCCRSQKLVIELDGRQHANHQPYDAVRTRCLEQHGYKVIRFWNSDFLRNPDRVMDVIWKALSRPSAAFPLKGDGQMTPSTSIP